jgi:hypothetical protein
MSAMTAAERLQSEYAEHRAAYREANPPISANDIEAALVALEIEKESK